MQLGLHFGEAPAEVRQIGPLRPPLGHQAIEMGLSPLGQIQRTGATRPVNAIRPCADLSDQVQQLAAQLFGVLLQQAASSCWGLCG